MFQDGAASTAERYALADDPVGTERPPDRWRGGRPVRPAASGRTRAAREDRSVPRPWAGHGGGTVTDLDGDRLLDLFGVALVLAIVGALVLLGLGASSVGEDPTPAPEVDWTLARVNESHVRLSHAGGEPVRADHLTVAVDGQPRRVRWSASTLVDGESGLVLASEGTRLTLVWEPSETDRRVLERWSV